MFAFTIIILICILALGVSLLVSHWSNGAKSGEAEKIETLYKKNWLSFFLISLRVLSFALVTAFLFLVLLASFAGDDAGECCFGSWYLLLEVGLFQYLLLLFIFARWFKLFDIVIIRIKSFLAFIVLMLSSYFVLWYWVVYLFLPEIKFAVTAVILCKEVINC